jgi:hypothetical protein
VSPPLINFEPLDRFHEVWYGGNVIQGDPDAIIFNPIASVISKNYLGSNLLGQPCLSVGLDCLCTMVTMVTNLFSIRNNGDQVDLDSLCTMATKLFTLG